VDRRTEETVDSYIVRVYRHEKDKPNKLMGIVEKVGEEGKKAFTHVDELWEILNVPRRLPKQLRKQEEHKGKK
jgi:hypothetical protein